MEKPYSVDLNFYKGKRVLITGHTGFKGSWLTFLLGHLGADVFGYSLEPASSSNLFCKLDFPTLKESCLANILDYKKLERFFSETKPEIVFHMAAQSLVCKSYEDPRETYATNVMGTLNLLEAARRSETTRVIINVTTDKCYENNDWPWPYRETDALGGYDPYSSSKACSEILTSSYRRSFLSTGGMSLAVATARAGNIIGGGDWAESRIVPDCFRSFLNNEPVIIRSPNSTRPWQHVLDPLHGYLQLALGLFTDARKYAGAWNFGPVNGGGASVLRLVKHLIEKGQARYGQTWQMKLDPSQAIVHEAGVLTLDCSKANHILGWRPVWNLDRSLDETLEWYWLVKSGENAASITQAQIDRFCKDVDDQKSFHLS